MKPIVLEQQDDGQSSVVSQSNTPSLLRALIRVPFEAGICSWNCS